MKKNFITLSVVSAFAFAFAGCENDNTVNPQPVGTVTIKGVVYADIDEEDKDNIDYEVIQSGVAIYAIDNHSDALLATTTTTATGYTFEIKVASPRDIRIEVGDFTAEINNYNFNESKYEKRKGIYTEGEDDAVVVYDVIKGATYIQDISISQPEFVYYE